MCIGALNPTRLEQILERFKSFSDANIPPFHYGLQLILCVINGVVAKIWFLRFSLFQRSDRSVLFDEVFSFGVFLSYLLSVNVMKDGTIRLSAYRVTGGKI